MPEPQDPNLAIYKQLVKDKPEPLKSVIAREQAYNDCTSCRVMGATVFAGLGAYTYWSGHRELRTREQEILKSGSKLTMAARRLGVTGLSTILVGLGVYRALA